MEFVNKKIELLAPAGNYDSFLAACKSGANAIYMGIGKFNARTMAENFDIQKYIECIKYAHMRNIKVYLTLNTLLYNNEIKEALEIISKLNLYGLDGVIVQDIGIASLIHELTPNLHLHASTQMSIYTLEQVKCMEKIGFKRVVLARELNIDEIEYICKNTELEIEVFIHGALCVSFSGQCLLSSMIGNRSANRGSCAQPCRMKYRLYDKKSRKLLQRDAYLLSKKDIYGLDHIERLINAGVSSLKIEGRNKNPEYVAGVVSIYRKNIDKINNLFISEELGNEQDKKELKQLFNRDGISAGYLDGVEYKNSITDLSPKNTGIYLGEVIGQDNKFIKIKLEEDIDMHDGIEIYSPDRVISNIITCIKNENGKIINDLVEKYNIVLIGDINSKIEIGSKVYKTSSNKLNEKYRNVYLNDDDNYKLKFDIKIEVLKNKNILTCVIKDDNIIITSLDYIPQIAKNKSVSKEDIISCFSKTKDAPFDFKNIDIILEENLFIPISVLNELRRSTIQKLIESYNVYVDENEERDIPNRVDKFLTLKEKIIKMNSKNSERKVYNSLYVYDYNSNMDYLKEYQIRVNKKIDIMYVNVASFMKYKDEIFEKYKDKVNIYMYIPNVVFKNLNKFIISNIENLVEEGISGFLIGSLAYMDILQNLKQKYDVKLIADYSLNITNTFSANFYNNIGFDRLTLLPEIDNEETINKISKLFNIELINDLVTVMTSRYCMIGSFIANTETGKKCKMPCRKSKYMLKDSYNETYDIILDNIDCIMRIVKRYDLKKLYNKDKLKVSVRNCLV